MDFSSWNVAWKIGTICSASSLFSVFLEKLNYENK
tara:strand:- start:697 stop:801 length:105 start_codon:yes stop_codon:yes gene_type:complete